MYRPLTNWKTSLLHYDCESCFVSHMLPCHVYAKLKQVNYAIHCMLYISLWFTIHFLYSWNYYLYTNICPSTDISYCILLNESNCNQYYMIVNSVPTRCIFHPDVQLCTMDTSCITETAYSKIELYIIIVTSMLYTCLWFMHMRVRKEIQQQKEIEYDSYTCMATTCCTTCGLAQEYREL